MPTKKKPTTIREKAQNSSSKTKKGDAVAAASAKTDDFASSSVKKNQKLHPKTKHPESQIQATTMFLFHTYVRNSFQERNKIRQKKKNHVDTSFAIKYMVPDELF